jgi:hypothetical protein
VNARYQRTVWLSVDTKIKTRNVTSNCGVILHDVVQQALLQRVVAGAGTCAITCSIQRLEYLEGAEAEKVGRDAADDGAALINDTCSRRNIISHTYLQADLCKHVHACKPSCQQYSRRSPPSYIGSLCTVLSEVTHVPARVVGTPR